ncbi:MAG TPA: acyltransferase [Bryobacteraceae bacterium]|nr:acyltransferase [Bryobacteraceae bacterium]
MKRRIELDFIRGIAILLVIHFHFSSKNVFLFPLPGLHLFNFGWAGVDLFFVLSGFLVGGLLCREWDETGRVDAGRFLRRRAFKIWPGYYALIAAYVITRKQPLGTFFWANVLNVQNYLGTSIAHTWSLAIEEHFYLIFTFAIAWCASRHVEPRKLMLGAGAVAIGVLVYRTFLALEGHGYFYQTHTRIDALLIGVMLAALLQFHRQRFVELQAKTTLWASILTGAVIVLLLSREFNTNGAQVIAADLGSVAFLMLMNKPAQRHSGIYRVVARIGTYSYGIYLWHNAVSAPVGSLAERIGFPFLAYPLRVVTAILLGVIMTKLIEFPFLRLREKLVPAAGKPLAAMVQVA